MTTYRLVMPEDMNHYGFLFGGKMLMWIDEVAWIAVSNDYPGFRFVTVGMSEVTFRKSVNLRAVLRFDAQRKRVGKTSVTYHVDVYRRDIDTAGEEHVFHTDITFVRVDERGVKMALDGQVGKDSGC